MKLNVTKQKKTVESDRGTDVTRRYATEHDIPYIDGCVEMVLSLQLLPDNPKEELILTQIAEEIKELLVEYGLEPGQTEINSTASWPENEEGYVC